MAWAWMVANGSECLIFDHLIADKSSSINITQMSSTHIQPDASEVIGWCFTMQMDNDPMHTAKATKQFRNAKKWNV